MLEKLERRNRINARKAGKLCGSVLFFCNVCGNKEGESSITTDGFCRTCDSKREFIRPLIEEIALLEAERRQRETTKDQIRKAIIDHIRNYPSALIC